MLKNILTRKKATEEPRVKQPKQNKRYGFLYVLFTVGLLSTGYLLSPYGRVDAIMVEGDTTVPEQLIIDSSGITSKQTMLATVWNENYIEALVKAQHPKISDVAVDREGLNGILLSIIDFETIAYIDTGNLYHSVLENGDIMAEGQTVPLGNKPLLTKFESGPILLQLITSLNEVSEDIQTSISEINYTGTKENPYTISFIMNDGNHVKANVTDFSDKLAYYPKYLQDLNGQKGVIDMEVGVFFTPFSEPGSES